MLCGGARSLAVPHPDDPDVLLGTSWAALGPRRLLTSAGQLNPADDLCGSDGHTSARRRDSGSRWTISGVLHEARSSKAATG